MIQLRQRMSEDMQVRNFALDTQLSYLEQVSLFARYFSKSPLPKKPQKLPIVLSPRKFSGSSAASSTSNTTPS